jgi:hypothetical protein
MGLTTHETVAEANIFQLFFSGRRLSRGGIHLLRSTCSLRQAAANSARRPCARSNSAAAGLIGFATS